MESSTTYTLAADSDSENKLTALAVTLKQAESGVLAGPFVSRTLK